MNEIGAHTECDCCGGIVRTTDSVCPYCRAKLNRTKAYGTITLSFVDVIKDFLYASDNDTVTISANDRKLIEVSFRKLISSPTPTILKITADCVLRFDFRFESLNLCKNVNVSQTPLFYKTLCNRDFTLTLLWNGFDFELHDHIPTNIRKS